MRPLALALVSGRSVEETTALLETLGRKRGMPTHNAAIMKAAEALGLELVEVDLQEILRSYPKPHCNVLKSVTTHHPRRFPKSWDPSKKYLAWTYGHICAIIGGRVEDWSVNNALRIYQLHEVVIK